MINCRLRRWEVAGFIFISLGGSALHFLFDWTGQWVPVAPLAPVNESVWEHLKMAFWPGMAFYAVQYWRLGAQTRNAPAAAAASLLMVPIFIILAFYSYTAVLGTHLLPLDVAIFLVAIGISQIVHYRLVSGNPLPPGWNGLGVFLVLILATALVTFTFHQPEAFVFRDPSTGGYGLP